MRPLLMIVLEDAVLQTAPPGMAHDSLAAFGFQPGVITALRRITEGADYHCLIAERFSGRVGEKADLNSAAADDAGLAGNLEPANGARELRLLAVRNILAGEGVPVETGRIFPAADRSAADGSGTSVVLLENGAGVLPAAGLGRRCDLQRSLLIGTRPADLALADEIGLQAVRLASGGEQPELLERAGSVKECRTWEDIADLITGVKELLPPRRAKVVRRTNETDIELKLCLDGTGTGKVRTGLRFFDHMLEQVIRHSGIDLDLAVDGDLDVDEHHTIEDTALAFGEAVLKALGDKLGISRYGFALPMDDAGAEALIDFSGRPWLVWEADFPRDRVGDVPSEMFFHFFKSFSDSARCNLQMRARGDNAHHIAEALFKAFARALRGAVKRDPAHMTLPTTKGLL